MRTAFRSAVLLIATLIVALAPTPRVNAQAPVNSARATLSHTESVATEADQLSNQPLVWGRRWVADLLNLPDPTAQTIADPSFEFTSTMPFVAFFPPEVLVHPPTYRWNFLDLSQPGFPLRQLPENIFLSSWAAIADHEVTARPLVTMSRQVTPVLLVGNETLQTVTVTLTIEEPLVFPGGSVPNAMHLGIGNTPTVYNAFTPVTHEVISHTSVPGWSSSQNGELVLWFPNPQAVEVGHTYTFEAVLRSTKSADLVGSPVFKPGVGLGYSRMEPLPPMAPGLSASIQHPTQPIRVDFNTASEVTWERQIIAPRRDLSLNPALSRVTDAPPFRVLVPANIRIEPEVVNLDSRGVLTAFVTVPEPYRLEDIEATTSSCAGAPAISGVFAATKLILKCRVQQLQGLQPGRDVPIRVSGLLRDGSMFEGVDHVRVK